MLGRIVRFDQLQQHGIPLMFIDSILPGHQRMNYALIGDTASENPEFEAQITQPHKFQIGMVKAAPGNGPAYHTHDYIEAFMPLSGRWRFYWGNEPDVIDGEATVGQWDLISLPPKLWRGFENVSEEEAWILGILEEHAVFTSKDPYWAPQISEQAATFGFHADESGKMIKPTGYDELRAEMMRKLNRTP